MRVKCGHKLTGKIRWPENTSREVKYQNKNKSRDLSS